MKHDSKSILRALRVFAANHRYCLVNSYVFKGWESDFFSITKKGTIYEYEVKISKADFKKDFTKRKHFFLSNYDSGIFIEKDPTVRTDSTHWFDNISNVRGDNWNYEGYKKVGHFPYCKVEWHDSKTFCIPARFYYACPEGLLSVYEIPSYAGLIQVNRDGYPKLIRQAPILHKKGIGAMKLTRTLMDKFYWLSENMRRELRHNNISFKESTEEIKD